MWGFLSVAFVLKTKTLLYDFGMNIGDTIFTPNEITHDIMQVVTCIDSLLISGKYRKKYNYRNL